MEEKEEIKGLERFPAYDGDPAHWVGSRDYWEAVLAEEKNKDPELHKAFRELHKKIVDMVVAFCKEHDLEVDEAYVQINGILGSKKHGEWTCATDSSMGMNSIVEGEEGMPYVDRDEPFLYQI